MVGGQGFGHVQFAQDPGIGSLHCDGAPGYVAALSGVLAASEADLGEGFIEAFSAGPGLGQFGVGLLAAADGAAGVPYGDAFDLVGCCFQPLRGGVDDGGLDVLPVGLGSGLPEVRDCLVVAPTCGVKPEFEGLSLLPVGIEPDPSGFGFGSGRVRGVGR